MTVIKAGGAAPCGDCGGACEARRRQSLRARYAYGLVFFATNLLAWFVRDYGVRALHGLHPALMSPNFDLQMCRSAEQGTPSASSPGVCFG
nr:unnamed protein product [Digitaria exilis]